MSPDLADRHGELVALVRAKEPRLTAVREAAPWVFAEGRASATGTESGIALQWDFFQVARYDDDGLLVWAASTRDRESALEAAGFDAWPT